MREVATKLLQDVVAKAGEGSTAGFLDLSLVFSFAEVTSVTTVNWLVTLTLN